MSIIDKFMLTGKKAIITGGSRGIGFAVANGFAELGADVAILDLIDGAEAVEALKKIGRNSIYIKTDVTNPLEVESAVAAVAKEFGSIDILFNNAGICINAPGEEMTYEQWRKVVEVDLDSVYLVSRVVAPYMLRQKKGSIINTASMSGHIVNFPQKQCGYNAAKAGVIHLTKSLAVEWAPSNVRVNCISPGYINTPMTAGAPKDWMNFWWTITPMGRIGQPEELVGAVAYLASDASTYTTGCDMVIDGGFICI